MQKNALIAIAAGLTAAVLHLSTQWGLLGALLFALIAPLPLFVAGLGFGIGVAGLAALTAVAAVFAATGMDRVALFFIADVMPVLLITRFALLNRPGADGDTEWYPLGFILAWLTLYGAASFVGAMLFAGTGPGGLEAAIAQYVDGFRNLFAEASRNKPALNQMLDSIKRVFPFLVVTWWIVIMVVNGTIAQKLLLRMGRNHRPMPDYTAIDLPPWLAPGIVAAAVAALVGSGWLGFTATNVALILGIPYFLAGLALLHAISTGWRGRTAFLLAVYLLMFLFGWPVLVIAGLGIVEPWAGLRARFGPSDRVNERKE